VDRRHVRLTVTAFRPGIWAGIGFSARPTPWSAQKPESAEHADEHNGALALDY
jgi:hypothetical protein